VLVLTVKLVNAAHPKNLHRLCQGNAEVACQLGGTGIAAGQAEKKVPPATWAICPAK
jgi:hypothetical protein